MEGTPTADLKSESPPSESPPRSVWPLLGPLLVASLVGVGFLVQFQGLMRWISIYDSFERWVILSVWLFWGLTAVVWVWRGRIAGWPRRWWRLAVGVSWGISVVVGGFLLGLMALMNFG